MESVITNSIVCVCALVAVSFYLTYKEFKKNEAYAFRFMVMVLAYITSCFCAVAKTITFSAFSGYYFHILSRVSSIAIMYELILITAEYINVKNKISSIVVSFLCYYAIAICTVDIIQGKGKLMHSELGVYFFPADLTFRIVYYVFATLYFIYLIAAIINSMRLKKKRRERRIDYYVLMAYLFTILGYSIEILMMNGGKYYLSNSVVFNIFVVAFVRRMLIYERSIHFTEADFAEALSLKKTDVVFVLDDGMNVIYENKRAYVLSVLNKDEFIGRKIDDIFKIDKFAYEQLRNAPEDEDIAVNAVYNINGRNISLVAVNKYDVYSELLYSVVTVYNIEEREVFDEDLIDLDALEEEIASETLKITNGGRVLVVEENHSNAVRIINMLESFEVVCFRCDNVSDIIETMKNNIYDLVFVAEKFKSEDGYQVVKRIRSLEGTYYKELPIVLMSDNDTNEIYDMFLGAGCSDYYRLSGGVRMLSAVLTRWLWQRFEEDSYSEIENVNPMSDRLGELHELIENAEYLYNNNKMDMFMMCIKGIVKLSMILGLDDINDLTEEVEEAWIFENSAQIDVLFERLKNGVRDAVSIG